MDPDAVNFGGDDFRCLALAPKRSLLKINPCHHLSAAVCTFVEFFKISVKWLTRSTSSVTLIETFSRYVLILDVGFSCRDEGVAETLDRVFRQIGYPKTIRTEEMLAIIEPLKTMQSDFVFAGQKRHGPLSNMAMLMLLRRMGVEGVTVHGFRSTFRDWVSEVANVPHEVAEKSLSHKVGNNVERAYARSDLLEKRRALMKQWSQFATSNQT